LTEATRECAPAPSAGRLAAYLAILAVTLLSVSACASGGHDAAQGQNASPAPSVGTVLSTRSDAGEAPAPRSGTPPPAPYTAPASCKATPFSGFARRRGFPAFWIDGQGLSVGSPVGVLYEGDQKLQWQATATQSGSLTVSGDREGSSGGGSKTLLSIDNLQEIGPGTWSSSAVFPSSGCWRVHASAGLSSLDTIIYVYPYECRPSNLRQGSAGPPGTCEPVGAGQ
jgi:hypothetical protein